MHGARRLVHEPDHGHELEVRQARSELLDEVDVEEILLRPGAVEEAHRTIAALLREAAQQRQDRRHAGAARHHQDRPVAVAQVEGAVGARETQLVSDG